MQKDKEVTIFASQQVSYVLPGRYLEVSLRGQTRF